MHRTNNTPTKPAASGFLFARYSPAYAVALVCMLAWAAALSGCGPSDARALQAVAADASQAPREAARQDRQDAQARKSVDAIAGQLNGQRPEHISEADWEAAKAAVRVTRDAMKGN